MSKRIKFAINGFGRIGRAVARQWVADAHRSEFELVAINDIAPIETCAYLLEFDSVYGPLDADIQQSENQLVVNGHPIGFSQHPDLRHAAFPDVDIVFECTGKAVTREFAERGLAIGAKKVLISGPADCADITIVLGANDAQLGDQKIVSNASCTTNALAPLMKALDDEYGLVSGHMTTIHCYTGSQPTVDAPRGAALERNRAAALSMVPTTTSATRLIDLVLPELKGRVEGCAVRVPTASVSAVDFTCLLGHTPDVEGLNHYLSHVSPDVLGSISRPLVSTDLRAWRHSLVVATPETAITEAGLVRVFGWYDNEWGFSARMFDVAKKMCC